MSLSERLSAAARVRDGIEEPAAPATEVRAAVADDPEPPAERLRIVAAASTPVDVVVPDPAAAPDAVCPTCGRTGELGVVDVPYRTADWSCTACGCLWQVTLPPPAGS